MHMDKKCRESAPFPLDALVKWAVPDGSLRSGAPVKDPLADQQMPFSPCLLLQNMKTGVDAVSNRFDKG